MTTTAELSTRYAAAHAAKEQRPDIVLRGPAETAHEKATRTLREDKAIPEVATPRERLLAVAEVLECEIGQFTLSELAVKAWKAFPRHFGLPGFQAEHPDVRKVACLVYGERGLLRQGLLVRVEGGRFRLA